MQCPKCGADQDDRNGICDRCGIVFAKYYKYHPLPGEPPGASPIPIGEIGPPAGRTAGLWLPREVPGGWTAFGARALLWLALLVWGARLIGSSIDGGEVGSSFMHLVNLPFHEAGHLLFRPFGSFMASLGGTLGQLLMPAVCLVVLLVKTRDPFGASVCLWWLGESFLDIAPYIADARSGELPLLGGNFGHSSPYGFHDWEYLLTETGLLHLDQVLGRTSHLLGAALMLLAALWGAVLLLRQLVRLRGARGRI